MNKPIDILILVHGITIAPTMEADIREHATVFDINKYEEIVSVDYNFIFDTKYSWLYEKIRKLPIPAWLSTGLGNIVRKHGDWVTYVFHKSARNKASRELTKALEKVVNKYPDRELRVVCLAHSLGTLVSLGIDTSVLPEDTSTVWCLAGSPLTFPSEPVRKLLRREVLSHAVKRGRFFVDKIIYLYNEEDPISGNGVDLQLHISFNELSDRLDVIGCGCGHDLVEYIDNEEVIEAIKIKEKFKHE